MFWRRVLAGAASLGLLPLAYADPLTDPVKPDENLLLFPALCWPAEADAGWQAELHAWVFEPPLIEAREAWRWLAGDAPVEAGDEALLRERLRWFLVDNERGKRLRLQVGAEDYITPPTRPDGHTRARISLSQPADAVRYQAPDGRQFAAPVACAPRGGVSVVSDIDDTLKISEVHDARALLANTFLRPWQAVEGMAGLYSELAALPDTRFHYLSASPWQLYVPLADFFAAEGLPEGSFHLKSFRLKDRSFFSLFADPYAYKLGLLEDLFSRLQGRRFILVGDSGEQDPEVYAEMARRHPGRVLAIVIRDVGAVEPAVADARYAAAWDGLEDVALYRFAGEVPDALRAALLALVTADEPIP